MELPANRLRGLGGHGAWLSCVILLLAGGALGPGAQAEQASQPGWPAAGQLDAGKYHTCAVLSDGSVRCWGYGGEGELGYPNVTTVGAVNTPASVGPVDLGRGRTATAISAGDYHTCALLDDGTVRCWGYGADGQLGYGNVNNIGDNETPGSVGTVDLGSGRTAKAITAGGYHTCALLDDGTVRCWGFGAYGQLGYPLTRNVGDKQTPGAVGTVDLGPGRTAKAISAGSYHTCALLDNYTVRCWGLGADGRLGYGNTRNVGEYNTPGSAGPVDLGADRSAKAVSAGGTFTCALLDDRTVRCWGYGGDGQLGYGNTDSIGDDETPNTAGPVNFGPVRTAQAVTAGDNHACAVLDDLSARCWGLGASGQLGYGNTSNVGSTATTPDSTGPVDLGPGHTAKAISAGSAHTCARLDEDSVRCWGSGTYGRLGYCNQNSIGDDEFPGSVGPVNLEPGDGGAACPAAPAPSDPASSGAPPAPPDPAPGPTTPSRPSGPFLDDGLAAQQLRGRALRACLRNVSHHARAQRSRASQLHGLARPIALRRIARRLAVGRARCLHRDGRTPGRVSILHAQATGAHTITLTFNAVGTDRANPPPARSYLIKQSTHPIRTQRDFLTAHALCHGKCAFNVTKIGATINQSVTDLAPHRTYYYAVAARDNISKRLGPRSPTVTARTQ